MIAAEANNSVARRVAMIIGMWSSDVPGGMKKSCDDVMTAKEMPPIRKTAYAAPSQIISGYIVVR